MTEEELKKVQQFQLDIVLKVKQICEKYNIKYFLVGGTLKGAVLYSGFVPWDGDLDIGMLREEYNKFCKIAPNELGNEYFLENMDTEIGYGQIFSKIKINGTMYLEKFAKYTDTHKGIFIDIFPFDNMPNGFKCKIVYYMYKIFKGLMLVRCNYCVQASKPVVIAFKILNRLVSRRSIYKIIKKITEAYNKDEYPHENAITWASNYKWREYLKYSDINNICYLDFCGNKLPVPNNYDVYLKRVYGDYTLEPPLSEQVDGHGIEKVNFGNYNIKYTKKGFDSYDK